MHLVFIVLIFIPAMLMWFVYSPVTFVLFWVAFYFFGGWVADKMWRTK